MFGEFERTLEGFCEGFAEVSAENIAELSADEPLQTLKNLVPTSFCIYTRGFLVPTSLTSADLDRVT